LSGIHSAHIIGLRKGWMGLLVSEKVKLNGKNYAKNWINHQDVTKAVSLFST